jgi:hypothetical protein
VNSAREVEISSGITTFYIVGCKKKMAVLVDVSDDQKTKMALLVDVSDDQKGLGSVLAISSNVLVENKVTPSAAMQMVRCIYMVFPLPPF